MSITGSLCRFASFLLYAIAMFLGIARSAASSFSEGLTAALFYGPFYLIIFPLFVGLGILLRGLVESLLQRPLPYRDILPWFAHLPLTITSLYCSTVADSPQTLFRAYIADEVPQSLSEVRYWHTTGFGNSRTILSYRLAPAEFDKVLSRYEYVEQLNSEGARPPYLEQLIEAYPDFPIAFPAAPLVYIYSHVIPGPEGGSRLTHYVTKDKDFVITIRMID